MDPEGTVTCRPAVLEMNRSCLSREKKIASAPDYEHRMGCPFESSGLAPEGTVYGVSNPQADKRDRSSTKSGGERLLY